MGKPSRACPARKVSTDFLLAQVVQGDIDPKTLAEIRGACPEHLYTEDQAPGAWPNGSRVRKTRSLPTDFHSAGALATILGSVSMPPEYADEYLYFVRWDDRPDAAVLEGASTLELVGDSDGRQ